MGYAIACTASSSLVTSQPQDDRSCCLKTMNVRSRRVAGCEGRVMRCTYARHAAQVAAFQRRRWRQRCAVRWHAWISARRCPAMTASDPRHDQGGVPCTAAGGWCSWCGTYSASVWRQMHPLLVCLFERLPIHDRSRSSARIDYPRYKDIHIEPTVRDSRV